MGYPPVKPRLTTEKLSRAKLRWNWY